MIAIPTDTLFRRLLIGTTFFLTLTLVLAPAFVSMVHANHLELDGEHTIDEATTTVTEFQKKFKTREDFFRIGK